jgi:hypothetical protein
MGSCMCGAEDCERCRPGCNSIIECDCGHDCVAHEAADCDTCGYNTVCENCSTCKACEQAEDEDGE